MTGASSYSDRLRRGSPAIFPLKLSGLRWISTLRARSVAFRPRLAPGLAFFFFVRNYITEKLLLEGIFYISQNFFWPLVGLHTGPRRQFDTPHT